MLRVCLMTVLSVDVYKEAEVNQCYQFFSFKTIFINRLWLEKKGERVIDNCYRLVQKFQQKGKDSRPYEAVRIFR